VTRTPPRYIIISDGTSSVTPSGIARWYLTPNGSWTRASNLAEQFTMKRGKTELARQRSKIGSNVEMVRHRP